MKINKSKIKPVYANIIKYISFCIFVSLIVFNFFIIYKNIVANYYSFKSYEKLNTNCQKSVFYALKSIKLNPNITTSYYNISYCEFKNNNNLSALNFLNLGYIANKKDIKYIRDSFNLYRKIIYKDPSILKNKAVSNDNYLSCVNCFLYKLKIENSNNLGLLLDIYKFEKDLNLKVELFITKSMITDIRPDVLQWHPKVIY